MFPAAECVCDCPAKDLLPNQAKLMDYLYDTGVVKFHADMGYHTDDAYGQVLDSLKGFADGSIKVEPFYDDEPFFGDSKRGRISD